MAGLLVGYARVSTEEQDLTAQRDGLARLGVDPSRTYVDHGLTGTTPDRPGLRDPGGLPRRRHPRRHQTGPARPLSSRRKDDRRGPDQAHGATEPRWVGL